MRTMAKLPFPKMAVSHMVATKTIDYEEYLNTGYLGATAQERKKKIYNQNPRMAMTIPKLKQKAESMRRKGFKVRIVKETSPVWGTTYRIWARRK